MSIILPPLPPPRDFGYYMGDNQGPPWVTQMLYDEEALRARDLEVARLMLEAAANVCATLPTRYDFDSEGRGYKRQKSNATYADAIRALEVKHG